MVLHVRPFLLGISAKAFGRTLKWPSRVGQRATPANDNMAINCKGILLKSYFDQDYNRKSIEKSLKLANLLIKVISH